MDHKRFNMVVEDVLAKVTSLMLSKNAEYARGGDKLHNFKKASPFAEGKCPEGALKGMLLKHTVSIYDMLDDIIAGEERGSTGLWLEKIVDHINYLIILYAMQIEVEDNSQ